MTGRTHLLNRWIGVWLFLGAAVDVTAEASVASAWDVRPYSYADDYVNFLGSPFTGTFQDVEISSPLWWLMTAGWITTAVLIATAGIALAMNLPGRRRTAVALTAALQGVGLIVFAVVPLGPDTLARGLLGLYLFGAFASIIAGNALAVLTGLFTGPLGVPRWARFVGITLGAVGLLNIPLTYGWVPIGIAERISVYSYLTWAVVFGFALLTTSRNPRT